MRHRLPHRCVSLVWKFAGECLEEHYAQRVNITAAVQVLLALSLLWAHISWCANDARAGQRSGGFGNLRDAKVRKITEALRIKQNVPRLDIAMDDALTVSMVERRADA